MMAMGEVGGNTAPVEDFIRTLLESDGSKWRREEDEEGVQLLSLWAP